MADRQGARAIGLVHRGAIRELTHARTFEADGSQGDTHVVTITARFTKCTCEAGQHGRLCYHVRAARLLMSKEREDRCIHCGVTRAAASKITGTVCNPREGAVIDPRHEFEGDDG